MVYRLIQRIVFISVIAFCSLPLHAEIVDRIVAIVNEDPITQSDVDRRLSLHVTELRTVSNPQEKELRLTQLRSQAINELIEEKLLERKVDQSDITISDQDLAGAIGRMLKQNGMSLDELKAELARNGISYESYKENLTRQMKQYQFLQREIGSKVQVTDTDLEDYYRLHPNDFQSFQNYQFSQILLTPKPNRDLNQTIEFAKSLKQQADAKTATFSDLAKRYSEDSLAAQGGDAGWVAAKNLNPELVQVLAMLKPGDISPPLPTQAAVLLVKLNDRKDPQASSLDSVKRKIENRIYEEKMDKALTQYLASLREKAYVQILN